MAPRIKAYEEQLSKVQSERAAISSKTYQMLRLQKSLDHENCPTCGATLMDKNIKEITDELAKLKKELLGYGDPKEVEFDLMSKIKKLNFNTRRNTNPRKP